MKKLKHLGIIGSLLLLLLTLAASPILLTSVQNQKLMQQVYTAPLPQEPPITENSLTFPEKIKIMQTALKGNGTVVQQKITLDDTLLNELAGNVKKQLHALEQLNVIPPLELTQDYYIDNLSKMIFLDADSPQKIVNVQEFTLVIENYSIFMWMDMETSMIYDFAIYSKDSLPIFKNDWQPFLFMKYLGLSMENVSYKGYEDGGWIIYSDDFIDLAINFERNSKYISYYLMR